MNTISVACVDVGSTRKKRLGWAIVEGTTVAHGGDPRQMVDAVTGALKRGVKVAIGFECPLYVPLREDPLELTDRRKREKYVNWCGGPGGSVLATGLVQARWVLQRIAEHTPCPRATTRWEEFKGGSYELFLWEAFITSKDGKRPDLRAFNLRRLGAHEHDAVSGAVTFAQRAQGADELKSELDNEPCISLIAWHLISSGLSSDQSLLSEPCVVVKARKRRARKQPTRM